MHAAVGGGNASVQAYLADALDIFDKGGFLWTQWIWRAPFGAVCSNYGIVCQPDMCGPYYQQTAMVESMSKYLGGRPSTAPIQAPVSALCGCINAAKGFCADATACKSCVWKHKGELIARGCDWDGEHSQIVAAACPS